jgi:hypothetical protein
MERFWFSGAPFTLIYKTTSHHNLIEILLKDVLNFHNSSSHMNLCLRGKGNGERLENIIELRRDIVKFILSNFFVI